MYGVSTEYREVILRPYSVSYSVFILMLDRLSCTGLCVLYSLLCTLLWDLYSVEAREDKTEDFVLCPVLSATQASIYKAGSDIHYTRRLL